MRWAYVKKLIKGNETAKNGGGIRKINAINTHALFI